VDILYAWATRITFHRLPRSPPETNGIASVKKLIVFDLDGTLADSKSPIDPGMAALLHHLLGIVKVAVISGGDWPQFEKQLLPSLPRDEVLMNLSLLPTCGTKFFQYTDRWNNLYSEDFTADEREKIVSSLNKAVIIAGFKVEKAWGVVIEDRGSQITFSALGQQAPLIEKIKWDSDFTKRKAIKAILDTLIPEFSIRMGGTTSIDVTKPGIDKAYGVKMLRQVLGFSCTEMIFIGDALFVGGNDYPVKETGVVCISVRGPAETKLVTRTILACMETEHLGLGKKKMLAEVADRAARPDSLPGVTPVVAL
jgi:phosphomannomutase